MSKDGSQTIIRTPRTGTGTSRALSCRTSITAPYTIIIDGREQTPFHFDGMRSDADKRNVPITVNWQWGYLTTGDYSLAGYESRIAIERKSLSDLYSTISQRREHFRTEFIRMSRMEYAAVVIEADWQTILHSPPPHSKLPPKNVYRTLMSWAIRYGVHLWPMTDVRLAEITTFRLLNRFYEVDQERKELERTQEPCDSTQPDSKMKTPLALPAQAPAQEPQSPTDRPPAPEMSPRPSTPPTFKMWG